MGERISTKKVRRIIEARIRACSEAEARYEAMRQEPNGGILGSVELAKMAAATECCARMELQHLLGLIFPSQSEG